MATKNFGMTKWKVWWYFHSSAFSLVVRWRPVAVRLVPPHRRERGGRGGEWNGGLYFLSLLRKRKNSITCPSQFKKFVKLRLHKIPKKQDWFLHKGERRGRGGWMEWRLINIFSLFSPWDYNRYIKKKKSFIIPNSKRSTERCKHQKFVWV